MAWSPALRQGLNKRALADKMDESPTELKRKLTAGSYSAVQQLEE